MQKRKIIRYLAILVILAVMSCSIGGNSVYAVNTDPDLAKTSEVSALASVVQSGSCGTSAGWTLDDTGLLTITGSGAISTRAFKDKFKTDSVRVVIESGITSVGTEAFSGCSGLTEVTIGSQVTSIGMKAFCNCSRLRVVKTPAGVKSIGTGAFTGTTAAIAGDKNSYANTYAAANGLSFVATMNFSDVPEGAWYYDAVSFVYYRQLMTGMTETNFGIMEPFARAQFPLVLYRLCGSPEVGYVRQFPDVGEGIWYTDGITWAGLVGVGSGKSDTGYFDPVGGITREQLAIMLYRYVNYKGYDTGSRADISKYEDKAQVSDYAREAMEWAVGSGIITGKYNETKLEPQTVATRVEAAVVIQRLVLKYEE